MMYNFNPMFQESKWFKLGYYSLTGVVVTVFVLVTCAFMSLLVDIGYWVRDLIF